MKKRLPVLLLVVMLLGVLLCGYASPEETPVYTIDTPYVYPVLPGTDEWRALKNMQEKIEACHVPEELLQNMTTEALAETVLTYPLLPCMFAFDTIEMGYRSVSGYFLGLSELEKREDAITVLQAMKNSEVALYADTEEVDILTPFHIDTICGIYGQTALPLSDEYGAQPYGVTSYVTTPKGTRVETQKNLTYSDHGTTEAIVKAEQERYKQLYPNATLIDPINPKYNCHSYAWYSTSTTNVHWMNDPTPYTTDGSYIMRKGTKAISDKVTYYSKYSSYVHSGIVSRASGSVQVISKWGILGVYSHGVEDNPYCDAELLVVNYWYR